MEEKEIRRGDIYHADLNPVFGSEQGGYRPVVIIQNNRGNKHSPTVIVAAITSRPKVKLPTHVPLSDIAGLEKNSVILLEQLRTIDKLRLDDYLCTLAGADINRINRAIRASTGIPKEADKPLILSLCPVCAGHFYNVPDHYIRRVNPEQRYKEICMFCNLRKGFDYYIGRKKDR